MTTPALSDPAMQAIIGDRARAAGGTRRMSAPRILAIETSCDETGVAVVVGGRRIEANQVATQIALHAATGGIVPEVAARQQLRWMVPTLRAAMREASGRLGRPRRGGRDLWAGAHRLVAGGRERGARHRRRHRPAAHRRQPHRGPHLCQLVDRCLRRRAAPRGAAISPAVPGRERRPHPAGADGGPRPLPPARPDRRRRRGRGIRQGRPPAGPAVSRRAGHLGCRRGSARRASASRGPGPTGATTSASPA